MFTLREFSGEKQIPAHRELCRLDRYTGNHSVRRISRPDPQVFAGL
jgi:hypothetical protein